jgi:hypothetical protein
MGVKPVAFLKVLERLLSDILAILVNSWVVTGSGKWFSK